MSWGDTEVKPEGGSNSFETPPEGNWAARVCAMIDVGSHEAHGQDGSAYQRRTLILAFEIATKKKDGTPFYVARTVTLSLAINTNLYSIVKTLSGEKKVGDRFDPSWVANKGCLVQITHSTKTKKGKERTYANIEAVTALPNGISPPAGSCVVWTISDRARVPLPDVSHLPPLYHEASSAMKTANEWVALSAEVQAERGPSQASDVRMQPPSGPSPAASTTPLTTYAQPMTQAEVDQVPF